MVDTGYTCPGAEALSAMIVSGPPAGVVSVGGYRFVMRELQTWSVRSMTAARWRRCPTRSPVTGSPAAPPTASACARCWPKSGVNPLLVGAFATAAARPRSAAQIR